MSVKDKVYIVTGSSSGIGKAVALMLAKEGARLTVHGRRAEKLEEVAREVESLSGHKPAVILGEIESEIVRVVIVETTIKRFGTIDGLVSNAGWASVGGWENEDLRAMQHMLDVHLLGPYDLCRRALPHIIKTQGSIVMVSSIASMRAIPGLIAYCTAKTALDGLTRALALDVAQTGVRVNSVNPGGTVTEISRYQLENPKRVHRNFQPSKMHPNGRLAQPEEIAECIVFLLSPKSQMLTGASIPVDGGLTASALYN